MIRVLVIVFFLVRLEGSISLCCEHTWLSAHRKTI